MCWIIYQGKAAKTCSYTNTLLRKGELQDCRSIFFEKGYFCCLRRETNGKLAVSHPVNQLAVVAGKNRLLPGKLFPVIHPHYLKTYGSHHFSTWACGSEVIGSYFSLPFRVKQI